VIAGLDYVSLIWSLALGIIVFGEVPGLLSLSGAGIIATTGLLLIWAESRRFR
jgi:S-adenosylmethionine uptake transporter